jgi:hypothetical protein
MYVRLVVPKFVGEESKQKLGIIRAAWRIQPEMTDEDQEKLDELFEWFNDFLSRPHKLARSKNKNAAHRAICWFKEDAKLYLKKAAEIAALVNKYGYRVEVLKTQNPGYIMYEDDEQVVAVPFKDTFKG